MGQREGNRGSKTLSKTIMGENGVAHSKDFGIIKFRYVRI